MDQITVFVEPGILIVLGLLAWGFVAFIAYLIVHAYRQQITALKKSLSSADDQIEALKKNIEATAKARERHLIKCTFPALHKMVLAVKKKAGLPTDQAKAFLESLIVLGGDALSLGIVRGELLKYNGKDQPVSESEHYFQLWWAYGENNSVSFFVNWKGLDTPFSLTVFYN